MARIIKAQYPLRKPIQVQKVDGTHKGVIALRCTHGGFRFSIFPKDVPFINHLVLGRSEIAEGSSLDRGGRVTGLHQENQRKHARNKDAAPFTGLFKSFI